MNDTAKILLFGGLAAGAIYLLKRTTGRASTSSGNITPNTSIYDYKDYPLQSNIYVSYNEALKWASEYPKHWITIFDESIGYALVCVNNNNTELAFQVSRETFMKLKNLGYKVI